jgi:hypothetical protein
MNNDKITRREFIEKTTITVASATVLPSVLESEIETKTKLPRSERRDRKIVQADERRRDGSTALPGRLPAGGPGEFLPAALR